MVGYRIINYTDNKQTEIPRNIQSQKTAIYLRKIKRFEVINLMKCCKTSKYFNAKRISKVLQKYLHNGI